MTFLRRSGARDSGKAHDPTRPMPTPSTTADALAISGRRWSSPRSRSPSTRWLDEHAAELAPDFEGIGTLDEQMAQLRKVMRLTYDAGFMSHGLARARRWARGVQPAAGLPGRGAHVA